MQFPNRWSKSIIYLATNLPVGLLSTLFSDDKDKNIKLLCFTGIMKEWQLFLLYEKCAILSTNDHKIVIDKLRLPKCELNFKVSIHLSHNSRRELME
jgi:hypothetical protein